MHGSQIFAGCKKSCARFLDGLAPAEIRNVLAGATQKHYAANSVIVNQGDPADHLFPLNMGRVRLYFTTQAWDRANIRRLAKCYPQILENALLTAGEYLAWYCATHAALVTQNAQQRLAQTIVCLAQAIGREVPDGLEIDVINEELASAAGITHFTTSRLLNRWQRSRVIAKRRGKIVLHCLERLFPLNG